MKYFDRDGSGAISLREFLVTLRGAPSVAREGLIKAAYEKLDVNKNGQVSLDEIAKCIDPTAWPEVSQGGMNPQDVYMQVMSLWDTQQSDGIVTWEEFSEFWRDVSAAIESDDEFNAVLKSMC